MPQTHDIFLRAYAVATDKQTDHNKRTSRTTNGPKWPEHALVFDTETRITADQSLTFGVYRICKLVNNNYELTEEGIFHADDLSHKELEVFTSYLKTAIPDVRSFPPRFPLYSRSKFMQKVFWPAIK